MNDVGVSTRSARPRASSAARGETRVDHQPAFVLHATAWRETSLIVEVLTRDFGRMALVARGAKRPTSQFRGLLAPFAPVAVSWSGRSDIKTLIRAEWMGGLAPLRGDGLLAAFYMNELLVRLLARADPHPALFAAYARGLHALASELSTVDAALRGFELDLLRETGWMPPLAITTSGATVEPALRYRIDPERGCTPATDSSEDDWVVGGTTIDALNARDWSDPVAAAECKKLLRALLSIHLDGRPLNTRRIFMDLKKL
jgi:DNA repair protein RecO (recombination protein O)